MGRRLTTAEVATRLGVKAETVYAYVSRGVLSSRREAGGSTFDAAEVARLAATGRRRSGEGAVRSPAFVTELTLIEGGHLSYRGVDVSSLTGTRTFEDVAEWLWTATWPSAPPRWLLDRPTDTAVGAVLAALPSGAGPIDRLAIVAATAATVDPLRHDLGQQSVAAVGRRLLPVMARSLVRPVSARSTTIAATVWPLCSKLRRTPERLAALDAALVLLADHEMAASTLAARTAAAFGADPYAVVGAGLGAASGAHHAAASRPVQELFAEAADAGPAHAVGGRLRDGRVPGLGHPLYPAGDPRAVLLLEALEGLDGPSGPLRVVREVLDLLAERQLPSPNVDFGLAALLHVLGAPVGAGEAVFALARTVGWLAHAIEQYAAGGTFRVRATYAGARP